MQRKIKKREKNNHFPDSDKNWFGVQINKILDPEAMKLGELTNFLHWPDEITNFKHPFLPTIVLHVEGTSYRYLFRYFIKWRIFSLFVMASLDPDPHCGSEILCDVPEGPGRIERTCTGTLVPIIYYVCDSVGWQYVVLGGENLKKIVLLYHHRLWKLYQCRMPFRKSVSLIFL